MLGVVLVSNVEFEDYSVKVKLKLKENAIAFLYELCGEIEARAKRNSRVRTSQTKGSFQHIVDEDNLSGHVGSDYENAIWEEFGTGIYAINGDGRKGYWVYVDDGNASGKKSTSSESYTLEEAKRIVAFMREEGLNAYYTKGKKPSRALWKAFQSIQGDIIRIAQERFGDMQ